MSKHTPGPWTVWSGHAEVFAGQVTENTRQSIKAAELLRVANCEDDDDIDVDEQRANAQLIAAAPYLLEVLKLVDQVFKRESLSSICYLGDDEHEAWAAVRSAIAKVEGK